MKHDDLILIHAPSVYDFRKESILYGPVSDLVPSTPVFEMYPIGFTTIAEYLERDGFRVRIVNLAVLMMRDREFDAEDFLTLLKPKAFGIDLHWMPHAHGSLAVAGLLKKLHPKIPVIFGGFSSTHFHLELAARSEVDFVVRGDSTEEPMRLLMRYIAAKQSGTSVEREEIRTPGQIPNLTWKDETGTVQANTLDYVPENLAHVRLDYFQVVRSVVRNRDLNGALPFLDWLRYPIMAALSCRGCACRCRTCGGSAMAMSSMCNRERPAYRSPEDLAADIWSMARWSRGPVFVLGDIRFGGEDYAEKFLSLVKGATNQLILEVLTPAPQSFFDMLGEAAPDFILQMSPESHDEKVRFAFGRGYSNAELEETIAGALAAGCKRFDLFFMIGLPEQTYDSVMETVEYCGKLMERFNTGETPRLFPFISPFAPFLDPGSEVFNNPEQFGYKLLWHTLEEHRQALVQPSWKHVLNYETRWMNRDEIARASYEAGLRFNQLKLKFGLIGEQQAMATEERIRRAIRLMARIDEILAEPDEKLRAELLQAIKGQVDDANISTVCDKRELEAQISGLWRINFLRGIQVALGEMWRQFRDSKRG
jgi:B12-binding domain/radical SAM domain protein